MPNLPIDPDRAALLCEIAIREYIKLLRLDGWSIRLFFEDLGESHLGQMTAAWAGRDAKIRISLESINNDLLAVEPEEHLISVVLHEIMHTTHRPYSMYFENTLSSIPGDPLQEMAMAMFHDACEDSVTYWMRLIEQILPPEAIIAMADEQEGLNGTE